MLNQQLSKTLIPTDKTSNMYRLTKEENNKMLRDTTTSLYKKTSEIINKKKKKSKRKRKEIVQSSFDNIINRMDVLEQLKTTKKTFELPGSRSHQPSKRSTCKNTQRNA